jgi:hypothetical protein
MHLQPSGQLVRTAATTDDVTVGIIAPAAS